ncbi:MAG: transposase [Gammaproteobacteria bacterium]|nr:transposase [Gammaproteobacteria bacterium]
MYRSRKVKLYLTKEQDKLLLHQLGIARWTYNHFLALRIRYYKIYGKHEGFKAPSAYTLSRHLTKIKQTTKFSWLGDGFAHGMQVKLQDLDTAFKRFWNGQGRFPKFKRKFFNDTMQYNVAVGINIKKDDNKKNVITLTKLGKVKYAGNLLNGKVKYATIKRHIFGRVDLTVLYELPQEEIIPNGVVALDANCHNFTDNYGTKYTLPAYCFSKKIKYWQKAIARSVKGSKNRFKKRQNLSKWCNKGAMARNDRAHKISNKISHRIIRQGKIHASLIILEDLILSNLIRKGKNKRGLNRSLQDSALDRVRRQLKYKSAGVHKIDKWFPSSKLCSCCGVKNTALSLSDRFWECNHCHTKHDRDINAAVNLYNKWTGNIPFIVASGGNTRPSEVSLLANSNSLMGWGSPSWRECKTECGYAASGNSL